MSFELPTNSPLLTGTCKQVRPRAFYLRAPADVNCRYKGEAAKGSAALPSGVPGKPAFDLLGWRAVGPICGTCGQLKAQ